MDDLSRMDSHLSINKNEEERTRPPVVSAVRELSYCLLLYCPVITVPAGPRQPAARRQDMTLRPPHIHTSQHGDTALVPDYFGFFQLPLGPLQSRLCLC